MWFPTVRTSANTRMGPLENGGLQPGEPLLLAFGPASWPFPVERQSQKPYMGAGGSANVDVISLLEINDWLRMIWGFALERDYAESATRTERLSKHLIIDCFLKYCASLIIHLFSG